MGASSKENENEETWHDGKHLKTTVNNSLLYRISRDLYGSSFTKFDLFHFYRI